MKPGGGCKDPESELTLAGRPFLFLFFFFFPQHHHSLLISVGVSSPLEGVCKSGTREACHQGSGLGHGVGEDNV